MRFLYQMDGRYWGYLRAGRVYAANGEYRGWVEGHRVYRADGRYLGRLTTDGFVISRSHEPKRPRLPQQPAPPETPVPLAPPVGPQPSYLPDYYSDALGSEESAKSEDRAETE